jgi:hypothetical protein
MVIFLITRLHEGAVYFVDRYFNRALDAVERDLGSAMLKAKELAEIDRLLTHEPFQRLNLTSAASFRRAGHRYVRGASAEGWDGRAAATLEPDAPLLAPCAPGRPFSVPEETEDHAALRTALPGRFSPCRRQVRCAGPHISGTDLDANERAMLARLAAHAVTMYAELENGALRSEIARLERKLAKTPAPHAGDASH